MLVFILNQADLIIVWLLIIHNNIILVLFNPMLNWLKLSLSYVKVLNKAAVIDCRYITYILDGILFNDLRLREVGICISDLGATEDLCFYLFKF